MPAGPFTRISNVVAAKQIAFAAAKGVTLALSIGFGFKMGISDFQRGQIGHHYQTLQVKGDADK
eukprot:gene13609-9745_t